MSIKESTDNQTVIVWGMADGTKCLTSFTTNEMVKRFSNDLGRPQRELIGGEFFVRATNQADDDIATGRLHRFSSVEAMLDSLNG